MPQPMLHITERITRPAIATRYAARAGVTGSIRFENARFEGWVSWVRLSLIRYCDYVS